MDVLKDTTHYIPLLPDQGYTENNLRVEVGYELGGYNWYNGATERRGYYLCCSPVHIAERNLESGRSYQAITQTVGMGNKFLLKEVSRKSKKAAAEAIALAAKEEKWLVAQVCARYGLKLAAGQTISFYSPIKARLEPRNGSFDEYEEPSYQTALDYAGDIERYIVESIKNEDETLGLLYWADEPLDEMIRSFVKSCSVRLTIGEGNIPLLVYSCELMPGHLPAIAKELSDAIADELEGQYSDGWGENLEQHPLLVEDYEVYIQVWSSGFQFTNIEITTP